MIKDRHSVTEFRVFLESTALLILRMDGTASPKENESVTNSVKGTLGRLIS